MSTERPSPAPMMTDIPLFADTDPEHLRKFSASIYFARYEPGVTILDFDDASDDVFFIMTGSIRAAIRTTGGREVILGDFGPGSIFGDMAAIDDALRSASITSLNRCSLWRMKGPVLIECMTHSPLIASRMLRILTERIRLGNTRLVELSALTGRHRLYAELLRLSRPRAAGLAELVISPPPAQQMLASRIGIRREAVSREISALMRSGVISRTSKALIIHHPSKLESAVNHALES